MKTRKIYQIGIVTVFISFIITGSVGAIENLNVSAIDNSSMIRLELTTPASDAIKVILYDDSERIVFNDQIAVGSTFEDVYDFSAGKKGTFRLVSEMGNIRYNRILTVKENTVEFTHGYYSFIPQFQMKGEMLMIHFLKEAEANVSVTLENEAGLIFDSYYDEPGFIFSEVFGLDRLQSGIYSVNLISGKEMFSHEFTIE